MTSAKKSARPVSKGLCEGGALPVIFLNFFTSITGLREILDYRDYNLAGPNLIPEKGGHVAHEPPRRPVKIKPRSRIQVDQQRHKVGFSRGAVGVAVPGDMTQPYVTQSDTSTKRHPVFGVIFFSFSWARHSEVIGAVVVGFARAVQ